MKRRSLLAAGGTLALNMGLAGNPRTLETLQAVSAGDLDVAVESLFELISHYAVIVSKAPSTAIYDDMLSIRSYNNVLISRANRTLDRRHSDLVVTAGWLSSLLAVTATDMCDHTSALVWCTDAERRGHDSGHPELVGWAALTKSLIAYYNGRAGRSVELSSQGQVLTPLGTIAHARLAAQEMRARAMLGDIEGMERAKREASCSIEALADSTVATSGAFSIHIAEEPPYTATSLLLAGRYLEAADMTRRVIDTVYRPKSRARGDQPTNYARSLLILGLSEAGLGEAEAAADAGHSALESGHPVWPTMVLAGKLDRTLRESFPDNIHVSDYHTHYTDLSERISRTFRLSSETTER